MSFALNEDIMQLERVALMGLWSELFGDPVPRSISKQLLQRIIQYEQQAKMYGGLPASTKRRLDKLAKPNAKVKARTLSAKTRLLREWNGVTHIVDVTDTGFLWRGNSYRSLSAIARAITGARWSGPRFFGTIEKPAKTTRDVGGGSVS